MKYLRIIWMWAVALLAASAWSASLCETGKRQSPIDITHTRRMHLPELQFDYRSAPLKMANDGHTLRVRLQGHGELRVGTERYRLQQFHFHTPSGDQLHGEKYPMVVHILHKGSSGQLLAIAVMVRVGAASPTMQMLLQHLSPTAGGDHLYNDVQVDALAMLPQERGYYRYSGSLTAPPCAEGVDWIIMKQTIEISAAQLAAYQKTFADNIRGPQPLQQRVVLESQ